MYRLRGNFEIGVGALKSAKHSDFMMTVFGCAPDAQFEVCAISVDRRITHSAVVKLCGAARDDLFAVRSGKLRRTRAER